MSELISERIAELEQSNEYRLSEIRQLEDQRDSARAERDRLLRCLDDFLKYGFCCEFCGTPRRVLLHIDAPVPFTALFCPNCDPEDGQ